MFSDNLKKKGVIEIQFNWMFILVAGALIILFFVALVQRQGDVSTTQRDIDIRSKLSTILTGAKQSEGTLFIIGIPRTEIDFGCNGYSVGGTQPFQLGESFSPSKIKSATSSILLWAEPWSLPYKISNFQYITSPDVRHIVISESAYASEVGLLLPLNVTLEMAPQASFQNLQNKNHYKVRIITVSDENGDPATRPSDLTLPGWLRNMKDEDVSALHIRIMENGDSSPFDGYGFVFFYKKQGNSFTESPAPMQLNYIKKETVAGAIITDSGENFECVMRRALEKYALTTRIYQHKAQALNDLYGSSPPGPYAGTCEQSIEYSKAAQLFSYLVAMSPFDYQVAFEYAYTSPGTYSNLATINFQLLRYSCPLIY